MSNTQTSTSGDNYYNEAPDLEAYARELNKGNETSWVTQMSIASLQASVQAAMLDAQINRGQELANQRLCFLDNAIAQICNCYNDIIARVKDITDKIPEPAMYQPVQPAGEQLETIRMNWEASPYINEFIKDINRRHQEADFLRQVAFNPKYYQMNENTWCSIDALIKGELEDDQVINILGDRAKTDLLIGRLGNNCRATWRALQVEKQNVKARGRLEQRLERSSFNQDVSPIARMGDIRTMQLTPIEIIGIGVQQGQFIQNSLQNAYEACAMVDPYLTQEMQLKLSECLSKMQLQLAKANLVDTFIPNYNSIFGAQINDAFNGLGRGIGQGRSVLRNNQPQPQAPIYTQPSPTYYPTYQECLVYGMEVLSDSKFVKVEDLQVGDRIATYDGYTTVKGLVKNHIREGHYVINGELKITNDHPVFTQVGWNLVERLNIGDFIGSVPVESIEYIKGDVNTVSILTDKEEFYVMCENESYRVSGIYSKLLK